VAEAELRSIWRKYESFRLRDAGREKYLLGSILQYGMREPLLCVEVAGGDYRYILLDGFKRLRCCCKLKIESVPVVSLGVDEVDSILKLIRTSTDRSLSTLEQARFVDELHGRYGLTVTEIADSLERSKAWVSVRLGIIERMSELVKDAVFSGRFPVRSYMYTLQPFTRVNGISSRAIDNFVRSVAGKGLSTREIEKLAYGYFRGGNHLRQQIEGGNLQWTLRQMKRLEPPEPPGDGMSEAEWNVVRDLELAQKYIVRILWGLGREDLGSKAFHAHALLLIEGLLEKIDRFTCQIRSFHDRRAHQGSGSHVS
jgi:ParB/RepB/Spo0J family partition protein